MKFRIGIIISLLILSVFGCSKDDDNETMNNPSGSNTTDDKGTYRIEFTGDQNFTVEGEADFSEFARDTLVQITLDEDVSAPSEGIITIRSSNGVFMAQTLQADAFANSLNHAAIVHENDTGLEFGCYSGTFEITSAEKAKYINATFEGWARDLDTREDTLQFTGTVNAKVR